MASHLPLQLQIGVPDHRHRRTPTIDLSTYPEHLLYDPAHDAHCLQWDKPLPRSPRKSSRRSSPDAHVVPVHIDRHSQPQQFPSPPSPPYSATRFYHQYNLFSDAQQRHDQQLEDEVTQMPMPAYPRPPSQAVTAAGPSLMRRLRPSRTNSNASLTPESGSIPPFHETDGSTYSGPRTEAVTTFANILLGLHIRRRSSDYGQKDYY